MMKNLMTQSAIKWSNMSQIQRISMSAALILVEAMSVIRTVLLNPQERGHVKNMDKLPLAKANKTLTKLKEKVVQTTWEGEVEEEEQESVTMAVEEVIKKKNLRRLIRDGIKPKLNTNKFEKKGEK